MGTTVRESLSERGQAALWPYLPTSYTSFHCLDPAGAHATWFKVPLEITRSGSGADLLKDVSKYHKNTRTVEFDLSRPLFLD